MLLTVRWVDEMEKKTCWCSFFSLLSETVENREIFFFRRARRKFWSGKMRDVFNTNIHTSEVKQTTRKARDSNKMKHRSCASMSCQQ